MSIATLVSYTVVPADVWNPLSGVSPNPEVFGVKFESKLTLIIAGVWALCLAGAVIGMLFGGGKWALHTKITHSAEGALEGSDVFKRAALAFGILAGMAIVVGAIIFIAS